MSPFLGCIHLLPIPVGLTAYAIKLCPYRAYKKRLWQTVHPQAPTERYYTAQAVRPVNKTNETNKALNGRNCIRISHVQKLHMFKNEFIFAIRTTYMRVQKTSVLVLCRVRASSPKTKQNTHLRTMSSLRYHKNRE